MLNKWIGCLAAAFVAGGCAAKLTVQKNSNFDLDGKILRVAVLPFSAKADEAETARQVREEIAANLQEGNFEIAEIFEVDEKLARMNLTDARALKGILDQGRVDWKNELGVDAVLHGRILEWSKTYLALHGDVELDVELTLYDAQSGAKLAVIRKGVIKSSGITRVPTGYISAGTAPIMGLSRAVQQHVIHTLTREITAPLIASSQEEISE